MKPTNYKLTVKSANATTFHYFETLPKVVAFCMDLYAMADSLGVKVDIELETGCYDSRGYEVGMN